MFRAKKYSFDSPTPEDDARRQAISLQQDVVTKENHLALQSGAATRRTVVPSAVHPLEGTTSTSSAKHTDPTQRASGSSGSQRVPLDVPAQSRMGSIGPLRTARRHPPTPPWYKAARGQQAGPNTGHSKAGGSRMVEAQQEHQWTSDDHRHAGFRRQPEYLEQAGGSCPVDCGKRLPVIYRTLEQAHTVRPTVDDGAPGPIPIACIDITPGAAGAVYKEVAQTLGLHKVRTALARQLIEAAMMQVPNPDGTYDLSDAAQINRAFVAIARTGGQSASLRSVSTTKDLADAWEAAQVAAIDEILQAHTRGNGA